MIQTVTPREFGLMFPQPAHIFNTVAFAEHNRHKCDDGDVRYLFAGDTKVRGGIILGRRGDTLHSPFSAPFGGLLTNREQRFEAVDAMWREILEYTCAEGLKLRVTLPPALYDPDLTVKSINSLARLGLEATLDVSYHLDLTRGDFRSGISPSCKRVLNQAVGLDAKVTKIDATHDNIHRIYSIVEANHLSKNRPVWMTFDDVVATVSLVGADFFIVTYDGEDIAGAMMYPTGKDIVQLIYWGDMPGHADLRSMNVLSAYMYEHYRGAGLRILDLGPATEDGVPNYGLCVFKESLGAMPTLKYTFRSVL